MQRDTARLAASGANETAGPAPLEQERRAPRLVRKRFVKLGKRTPPRHRSFIPAIPHGRLDRSHTICSSYLSQRDKPSLQYHLLSAPLDMGAMGLMIPMVETEEQARMIVQFAKYYPAGQRGAAFGFAHDDYKVGDVFEKMKSANEEVLLAALVETATGI